MMIETQGSFLIKANLHLQHITKTKGPNHLHQMIARNKRVKVGSQIFFMFCSRKLVD